MTHSAHVLSRRPRRLVLALIALGALAVAGPASAVVELNITQGTIQPLPIAIPDFTGDGSIDPQVASEVSTVVANDLKSSGLFLPIDQAAFIEKSVSTDSVPRFEDWQVLNTQALVVGRIGASEGRLKAEFRLWDVFAGKQLAGEQFYARPKDARRIGHIIADSIYERITGEKGYFDAHRVRRRIRAEGQTGEAPRHHGSGRLQRQVADHRAEPGADAAVQSLDPGDHLYILRGRDAEGLSAEYRDRAEGDRGQLPRHDLRAAVFAGRPAHRHESGAGRQFQLVRHGFA
jgi:hypothetical protein